MGRNAAYLNDKQLDVLVWIRDGCPAGSPERDSGRRITARGLERRGLVTIKGHGTTWKAAITAKGLVRLPLTTEVGPAPADAEALLQRVVAAGGRLGLAASHDDNVEDLVRLSHQSPSRPTGWRLEVQKTGPWDNQKQEVVLARYIPDEVSELPVPVPVQVSRYHQAVREFVRERGRQRVTADHLTRAAHIRQAIADEAPRRGLDVLSPKGAARGLREDLARTIERSDLALSSSAGANGIRIREVSGPSEQSMVDASGVYSGRPTQLCATGGYPGRRTQLRTIDQTFVSSGVLELIVEGPGTAYGGDRYRDGKTVLLEGKLPRLFRSIEIHRLEAEQRAAQREREAADRRARWEAAMTSAKARYADHVRWSAIEQAAGDWRRVSDVRDFIAALRDAERGKQASVDGGVTAQLEFAEHMIEELDPLAHLDRLVTVVPDPRPDDLKPFLDGWSPYGPDGW